MLFVNKEVGKIKVKCCVEIKEKRKKHLHSYVVESHFSCFKSGWLVSAVECCVDMQFCQCGRGAVCEPQRSKRSCLLQYDSRLCQGRFPVAF